VSSCLVIRESFRVVKPSESPIFEKVYRKAFINLLDCLKNTFVLTSSLLSTKIITQDLAISAGQLLVLGVTPGGTRCRATRPSESPSSYTLSEIQWLPNLSSQLLLSTYLAAQSLARNPVTMSKCPRK
jgi:hypothetical protein